MEYVGIVEILKERPVMLSRLGKVLNTWKLLIGYVPVFTVKWADCVINGERTEVSIEHGTVGHTIDGLEVDITTADYIYDIDVEIEKADIDRIELIGDIVLYKNMLYTLYEILETEVDPVLVNSLPMFDHNKMKIKFGSKVFIGHKSIDLVVHDVKYFNIKFEPSKYSYVTNGKIEVPFSCFHNKECNEKINELTCWNIPLLDDSLRIYLR